MPVAPRPYDPVEEAAAAMGVANLRPRYFISGSPDATVGLNARYGQAVQQASDLGFDLARRPYLLEQERLQTEAAGMGNEILSVKTDRVRNALANRGRIESVLADIDPKAPNYRAKRKELAALGADEILGPELSQIDREAEPYEKVREELGQRDMMEKELGPKREAFLKELTSVDPNLPDFRKRTFDVMSRNPWILQDPVAYRALEDFSRTGYEQEQLRRVRERELLQLDPDTRKEYDRLLKEGGVTDPDNALFAAQRYRQTKLLKLQAKELGIDAKTLADLGDDPDLLAERVATRRGEMLMRKQQASLNRSDLQVLNTRLRAEQSKLRNADLSDTDRQVVEARIDEIMDDMDKLGSGGTDSDAEFEN
jgi:hypothetical protein